MPSLCSSFPRGERARRAIVIRLMTPALVGTLLACGNPAGEPPRPVATHLEGPADHQIGSALEVLPDVAVLATDADGHAVPGVGVAFTIVDGGGTLSTALATSDALGNARVQWTLGPRTGVQHLRAALAANPAVTATMTATARQQLLGVRQGAVIELVNADNLGEKILRAQGLARSVAWSPDGRRIAFTGRPDNSQGNGVYVMNADGTGATALTAPTTTADENVDWSPDGKRLLFTRGERIFVMNVDGTGLAQLSNTISGTARWSPDGTRIAFSQQSTASPGRDIAVMNADGSGLRYVTTNQGGNDHPEWSPDGTQIVYMSGRAAHPQLYVIGVDGAGEHLLTPSIPDNHLYDGDPAWSRDGTLIAFARAVSSADGTTYTTAMYTIHPDGTGLTLAITGLGAWETPRWRP